uniref:Aryl hydrocarbon receptor n=1 Tax=Panagrellus redivivus TaxID=6233 RepID=A0A7E5A056_PANRE
MSSDRVNPRDWKPFGRRRTLAYLGRPVESQHRICICSSVAQRHQKCMRKATFITRSVACRHAKPKLPSCTEAGLARGPPQQMLLEDLKTEPPCSLSVTADEASVFISRIRESNRPNQPTNPSKRHRERLNGELETVAALLPYDDATIQRLDKLSVLRLAVSFVQIKAHFALCLRPNQGTADGMHLASLAAPNAMFTALSSFNMPIGPVPTMTTPQGHPVYDYAESSFSHLALKSIGGFVVVLTEWGDLFYVSENIDQYLGFCQSDVLHQPLTDLLHSEDRDSVLRGLRLHNQKVRNSEKLEYDSMERTMVGRFRCLLDNTCGFVRMEIRGRFMPLSALASPSDDFVSLKDKNSFMQSKLALAAICTPFVPPVHLEQALEDPILKTKHGLDLSFLCVDSRLRMILEIDNAVKSGGISFYQFVHPDDAACLSECHEETRKNGSSALLVLRVISTSTNTVYYFQSSFRLFYKSGKAESIGITHRYLTEIDGLSLLEKRGTIKGSAFTHDEPSLQSPRNLNTAQNLPPMPIKVEPDSLIELKPRKAASQPSEVANDKPKKRASVDFHVPPPATTTGATMKGNLGAISCLEELVKASTSTLGTAVSTTKEALPIKRKKAASTAINGAASVAVTVPPSMPIPTTSDNLSALSAAVFPTYLPPPPEPSHHVMAPPPPPPAASYPPPMWPPAFDNSYYGSHHQHPVIAYPQPSHHQSHVAPNEYFPQPWFPEYAFPEYSHTAAIPTAPAIFHDAYHHTVQPTAEENALFTGRFALPALSSFTGFPSAPEKTHPDEIPSGTNNFSFLNEVAHTLFGQ